MVDGDALVCACVDAVHALDTAGRPTLGILEKAPATDHRQREHTSRNQRSQLREGSGAIQAREQLSKTHTHPPYPGSTPKPLRHATGQVPP